MKFLLPQGIGDSVWALHKIEDVAKKLKADSIEVYLNCSEENETQVRALDFVRRFDFVNSVRMLPGISIHPTKYLDENGCYNYIPDGPTCFNNEQYYALMPNGHLERGHRLEDWLPEFEINWNIMNHFKISSKEAEFGETVKTALGGYAVFYLGPLAGNMFDGHNRDSLWTPQDWVDLGKQIKLALGIEIVIVGAPYDWQYYSAFVKPLLHTQTVLCTELISRTSIGELYALTSRARFVISYQSGVGIVSSYMGVPTGIFWRPKGNSISPNCYLSFEEEMASAWVNPQMIAAGKHLPLIYYRHGVDYIMEQILKRGW